MIAIVHVDERDMHSRASMGVEAQSWGIRLTIQAASREETSQGKIP
jgi:hypothetical protein